MKLFQFQKTPPPRQRRRKISHKWVDRAKSEVSKMPSLANLEEDIVIKAAILSAAGHYSFKLDDFTWGSPEEAVLVQKIIWGVEALQENFPRYLQGAKWVAIKQAVDIIEGKKHKGYRKKKEEGDYGSVAPEAPPPPDMGQLMQEEWERYSSGYRKRVQVSQPNMPLAHFLMELNKKIQAEISHQSQPPGKPDGQPL
jgi:hypothetical protein